MRTGRRYFLPIALLSAAFAGGCLTMPDAEEQIERLVYDRNAAVSERDVRALYRLQDPDFRAVCDFDAFRTLPIENPSAVQEVRDIAVRGVRGTATVVTKTVDGTIEEQRAFIQDAGRWYLYEDAGPCLAAGGQHISALPDTGRRHD